MGPSGGVVQRGVVLLAQLFGSGGGHLGASLRRRGLRRRAATPESTYGAGVWHDDALFGKAGCMQPEIGHPVVSVFRSRLLKDAETSGYGELAARMEDRA
ncbi:MAG: hypothetical protein ACYDEY_11670 [Acidimicrobiales bacterium]